LDHAQRTTLFHQLIWPLRADVLRTARMLTREATEADDLTQDVLIKAFHAIESYQPRAAGSGGGGSGGGAKAWLMAILRNARIDRLRSAAHYNEQISLDAAEMDVADVRSSSDERGPDSANLEELIEQLSDAHLIRALQDLPEEIRWTMLLVEVQGLSHEEAAEVMGVPPGTVKSRAFRGRAMLKATLLEHAREMRLTRQ
jgi:RNA polymerase sigma-70 factor, ECF subfamily